MGISLFFIIPGHRISGLDAPAFAISQIRHLDLSLSVAGRVCGVSSIVLRLGSLRGTILITEFLLSFRMFFARPLSAALALALPCSSSAPPSVARGPRVLARSAWASSSSSFAQASTCLASAPVSVRDAPYRDIS